MATNVVTLEAAPTNITIPYNRPAHPTSDVASKKQLAQLPSFTCFAYGYADEIMLAGRYNGELVSWKLNGIKPYLLPLNSSTHPLPPKTRTGGSSFKESTLLGAHKGTVTCISYSPELRLAVTGSSDTSIKLWDPFDSGNTFVEEGIGRAPQTTRCVQTIAAHDATVQVIQFHCNLVISGSADKSVKVWCFEKNRDGFAGPWLVAKQAFIFDSWITSIWALPSRAADTQSDEIYVGDSQGNLTVFKSIASVLTVASSNSGETNGGSSGVSPGDKHNPKDGAVLVSHLELVRSTPMARVDGNGATVGGTGGISGSSSSAIEDIGPRAVTAILPLPSSNLLVTLGHHSCAIISDLSSGAVINRVVHPDSASTIAQVSKAAASGGAGINATKVNPARFLDVVYFHEREEMVLLDNSNRLLLWSLKTNTPLSVLKAPSGSIRIIQEPTTVRSNRQCFWLAHREAVECYSVHRQTAVVQFQGHTGRVVSIASSPLDNSNIDFAVRDSGSRANDAGETSRISALHDLSLQAAFASASVDNTICLWNNQMKLIKSWKEKQSEISAFLFLPQHDCCITGHDNGTLKVWGILHEKIFRFPSHDNTVSSVGLGGHLLYRGKITPSPHIFTVSYDGCLAVWPIPEEAEQKPNCLARVRVSNSELLCAVYDSINYLYIVGGSNGTVTMWSVDELKPVRSFRRSASIGVAVPAHSEGVTSIVLDGNMAFTGGEDRKLFVWNTLTGERSKELRLDDDDVNEMQEIQQILVLPENGDVLVCTRSGQLLIFSQDTGFPIARFDTTKEVATICWARQRQEIIAGLDDGTVMQIHLSMMRRLGGTSAEGGTDNKPAFLDR